MAYISRKEWGAKAPKSRVLMHSSAGIHVHHTTGSNLGRDDCKAWVRSIQVYHMDNLGWSDIGYSFLVCKHGDKFRGRGWGYVGAHTKGYNSTSHGIAYLGDGGQEVPRAAIWAYQDLKKRHNKKYGKGYVKGHKDRAQTACPGDLLYAKLPKIRRGPIYGIRWRIKRPDGTFGPVRKRRKVHRWFHRWLDKLKPGQKVAMKKLRKRI